MQTSWVASTLTIIVGILVLVPATALVVNPTGPLADSTGSSATDTLESRPSGDQPDATAWKTLFPHDPLDGTAYDLPLDAKGDPLVMQGKQAVKDVKTLAMALERAPPQEALALLVAYGQHHDLPVPPKGLAPLDALRSSGIDPKEIPVELREPTGRIWSAMLVAEAMREEALKDLSEEERERLLADGAWGILPVHKDELPRGTDEERPIGVSTSDYEPVLVDSLKREIADKIDQDMLIAASLHLLSVIEQTLPELGKQVPTSAPVLQENACTGTPTVVAGLIALDLGGSTLYTNDYLLSIDLSGDDCYTNSAGGARNGVAVAIDLSGNDHYTKTGNTSTPVVAQGAASLGIGILVDLGGDDVYRAEVLTDAPEPGPIAAPATVIAQGGANIGIGILADLGGEDVFYANAFSSGNNATVIAQGGADTGIAVALSGPMSGHTEWTATATSQRHIIIEQQFYRKYLIGGGDVLAQGGADAGIAAIVDVSGNDVYTAEGIGGRGDIIAQGGSRSGIGLAVDGFGEDSYSARGDGFESLSTIVTSDAFCWRAFTNVETEDVLLLGQGGGVNLGIGALVDVRGGNGNDLTMTAITGAEARTEVRNSADPNVCINRANSTAITGSALAIGQGAADTGIGVLLGSFENDAYHASGNVIADATSLVFTGRDRLETATATAGDAGSLVHGYGDVGIGVLIDPLADDSYIWSGNATSRETTSDGTRTGTDAGVKLQGLGFTTGGLSIGWLFDLGGEDRYPLDIAGNRRCWTAPDSAATPSNLLARGRDWDLLGLQVPCI